MGLYLKKLLASSRKAYEVLTEKLVTMVYELGFLRG